MGKYLVALIEFPFMLTDKLLTELFHPYRPVSKEEQLQKKNKGLFASMRKLQIELSMQSVTLRKRDEEIYFLKQRILELKNALKAKR